MNAVDTNVLIYRLDRSDPVKQARARDLLRRLAKSTEPTVVPWQVLGELVCQLRRWQNEKRVTRDVLLRYVAAVRRLFPVVMPTASVLDRALDLTGKRSLSHWDSMLLGACLDAGVDTLYTEDMGAPTTCGSIRLLNPFT